MSEKTASGHVTSIPSLGTPLGYDPSTCFWFPFVGFTTRFARLAWHRRGVEQRGRQDLRRQHGSIFIPRFVHLFIAGCLTWRIDRASK